MPTQETTVCSLWAGWTHKSYYCADGFALFYSNAVSDVTERRMWWQLRGKWRKTLRSLRQRILKFIFIQAHLDRSGVCSFISFHIKSWVWCFEWPRVCAWNLVGMRCCLCVLTEGAVSQSGREMLKSFQPTRLHGVSSPLLFIWHLVNHYCSHALRGYTHSHTHIYTLDDNCLLTS